ncbi:hypothetical protein K5Q02_04725 [Pseudomonas sp. MM211]|uniref:hypothetical protein n=1 Tax=Pseudomonas sp. MM211 TaxID=2866808 RepID=UPI001CEC54E1|nr:hypothetical protein [Pseudomonas sp. MM211]UCJ17687.1 hypothetical protein K5Q02_04725 [Pseudomonas sp. MM211]
MSDWVDTLYRYCEGVLGGDQTLIEQLRDAGFDCREGCWSFHLPALHAWLGEQMVIQSALDYPIFLQRLYASDLNGLLAQRGAQIVIADNHGKVSESLYRLQRLP